VSTDSVFRTAGPGELKLRSRFNRQCVPDSRSGRIKTTWSCQLTVCVRDGRSGRMETTLPCQPTVCSRLQVRANGNYTAVSTDSAFQTADKGRMETTWQCQPTVCSRLQVRANGKYVAVSNDSLFQTADPGEWKLRGRINQQCVQDCRSGRMETTWPCQPTVCFNLQVRANENYVALSTDSVFQTAGPGEWNLRGRVN